MGLRFVRGFGCSPNHASRANRHFLFFAAPKNESRQLMERRHLANQKTLLNRPLERAVALPFWISGCLLFAIRRVRRFIARSVENLCPSRQPEIRPQTVDAAAGCRGLLLLVAGGETPARAND